MINPLEVLRSDRDPYQKIAMVLWDEFIPERILHLFFAEMFSLVKTNDATFTIFSTAYTSSSKFPALSAPFLKATGLALKNEHGRLYEPIKLLCRACESTKQYLYPLERLIFQRLTYAKAVQVLERLLSEDQEDQKSDEVAPEVQRDKKSDELMWVRRYNRCPLPAMVEGDKIRVQRQEPAPNTCRFLEYVYIPEINYGIAYVHDGNRAFYVSLDQITFVNENPVWPR